MRNKKNEQATLRNSAVTEETKSMRDKDVLFGIILILSSCSLIVYSLMISLEAMETMDVEFYIAPGFSVMVIGIALLVLSISLVITALRQGGGLSWLTPAKLIRIFKSKPFWQTLAVFFYLFLYMWAFWGKVPWLNVRVPFWFTTFIFLNLMMITFRATKIVYVLLISGLTSFLVYFAFGFLAHIPLP